MNDKELVELIAQIWISHGGDADGFTWCKRAIEKKIKELIEIREGKLNV